MTDSFQTRTFDWLLRCFGKSIAYSRRERMQRFFEESCELVQAGGLTKEEAQALLDYTYSRPVGDLPQEIGGVQVCLASLSTATGYSLERCAEAELLRAESKIDAIRAKHAKKPDHIVTTRVLS